MSKPMGLSRAGRFRCDVVACGATGLRGCPLAGDADMLAVILTPGETAGPPCWFLNDLTRHCVFLIKLEQQAINNKRLARQPSHSQSGSMAQGLSWNSVLPPGCLTAVDTALLSRSCLAAVRHLQGMARAGSYAD